MSDTPKQPSLCTECQRHVDASNLEWVLCGGLCIGMEVTPKVWTLRDKGEMTRQQQITKDLQKMANMAHENAELREQVQQLHFALSDVLRVFDCEPDVLVTVERREAWAAALKGDGK